MLLVDCHSDTMVDVFQRRAAGERDVLRRVHLPRLAEGGVGAAVFMCGGDAGTMCPLGPDRAWDSALAFLEALYCEEAEAAGAIGVAGTANDVRELTARGVFAIVPMLEGARALEGRVERLPE